MDSLGLDGENRERTRLRLFKFSLRDQASNWLERLPAGSITTWEDLATRFLAQFFPLRRTVKLRNDILMFQQHHGESLSEAWTRSLEDIPRIDTSKSNTYTLKNASFKKRSTIKLYVPNEMLRNCHGHNLSKGNIIKIFYHGLSEITQEVLNVAADGISLYKTPNQAYQLHEDKVLLKLDWAKKQKTKSSLKKTIDFVDEGSSNSDTENFLARMDVITLKMDAQYKEL
ncbi:reverse transcriptase domain-containing protein [Tanacetum coccineum]